MKKALQIALGILTGIGGFFDIGNLVTGAQAGAQFRFQLLWALLVGTVMVILLVEMAGRFSAVTKKAIPEAIREHLGMRVWAIPFVVMILLHVLTLAAEIGGISFALQLLTGVPFAAFAVPVGALLWLFLWRATFNAIEYSTAVLGMIALSFVFAATAHHPPWHDVLAGLVPSLPAEGPAKYWLIAVSIMGAVLAPYMFYFYSSGAIEDEWDQTYIGVNRFVAVTGMGFGAVVTAGLIIVAAMVLEPKGINVDSVNQAALVLTEAFPFWGFALFAGTVAVACTGAASEVSLSLAYTVSQTFGWKWGESLEPAKDARFALTYTAAILVASLIPAIGVDPFKLTMIAMALNATLLPVVTIPFLLLMNDRRLLREHANGPFMNVATIGIVLVSLVLFVVSIPLLVRGG
jgi:Mn2+/Fe2+ NRAMP family transporter